MVLEQFVPLLQMSSGRRISVLNQMRQLAVDANQPTVVAHIDLALAHDAVTRDYDNQWAEPARRSLYAPEVKGLDRSVDIGLTSIRDIAVAQVRGLPASNPLVVSTEAMLDDVFPAGVSAITSLPYIDEVAACEVVIDKLRDRWASTVTELGLDQRVAYLEEQTRQYREAVDLERNLTFATVQTYRKRGQQMLRELVVLVLALYHDSTDPSQVKARALMLKPLVIQLDDIRAHNRSQRNRTEDGDGQPGDGQPGDGQPGDGQPGQGPGGVDGNPPDVPGGEPGPIMGDLPGEVPAELPAELPGALADGAHEPARLDAMAG